MSLQELGMMLRVINNNGGYNPDSACQAISVRTAGVLMGTAQLGPYTMADDVTSPPQDGIAVHTGTNAGALLAYLQNTAPMGSVLRVENDNHAWNFIKDYHGSIHLIDVSCWNFVTIGGLGNLVADLRNDTDDPPVPFNYGSGAAYDGKKNIWHQDSLELFRWGAMAVRWSRFLRPRYPH